MQKGLGVSRGIAMGKALVYDNPCIEPTNRMIPVTDIGDEKTKIRTAMVATQRDLQRILDEQVDINPVTRDLIEVQLEMAEDPTLLNKADQFVEIALNEAGDALLRATDEIALQFGAMDEEYYRARAADIRDVGRRLAANAFGVHLVDLSHLDEPVVVFARDISPSETATMDKENVLGFITEQGSQTSHTAIIAKMLEIPAIVGLRPKKVRSGQLVIIDGATGELVIEPNPTEVAMYDTRRRRFVEDRARLNELSGLPAVSKDGIQVELAINIARPHETTKSAEVGADGVGLFRTEFVFMESSHHPTEDEQYISYRAAAQAANGQPVIIRTLDAGGDKDVPYLKIPAEDNPFLGYRAIRICLDNPEMFKTQLRAILRSSADGNVKIMFPMISALSQLLRSRFLLEECKQELREREQPFNEDIEVGIMVEIPAVAAAAELFAPYVQFFSIGTNDLCQYSLAVDRMNPKIADLYSHYNPGVLRLIKHTIDAAKAAGIKVAMCGEMAGAVAATPLLFGFGLDEFSMSPSSIPYVKDRIRGLTRESAQGIVDTVMAMDSATAIKEYLEKL